MVEVLTLRTVTTVRIVADGWKAPVVGYSGRVQSGELWLRAVFGKDRASLVGLGRIITRCTSGVKVLREGWFCLGVSRLG